MLILLSGYRGSGKDTSADFFSNNYEYTILALAEPLKDAASKEFNIPRHWFDDRELKESVLLNFPAEARDAFSTVVCNYMLTEFKLANGRKIDSNLVYSAEPGKSLFQTNVEHYGKLYHTPRTLAILKGSSNRVADPDYWVKQLVQQIKPRGRYVVTDVRYKNEIESLKRLMPNEKVVSIRINRFDKSDSQDASERDLDDHKFDYYISNNGSLDELYEKLDFIVKTYL